MYKNIRNIFYLAVFINFELPAFSQNIQVDLSESKKAEIINKATRLLRDNYIFPKKADTAEIKLLTKIRDGGYSTSKSPEEFLHDINTDLEQITGDKHVNISYGPDRVKQIISEKKNAGKPVPITKEWHERLKYENFRLRKVEWLDGNIGYFRFLSFTDLQVAKESIVGAMNFIRNSNAIILDLRDNGGGNSETLNFILSYFLKSGLKTGEFHYRKNNRIEEIRIPSDPAVHKIPDNIPVYILVSNRTSSAAEGLASTLRAFKRAVIVGETTKGEGNPGELFAINDQFYILIPTAISVSAVAGTEPVQGTGVKPDIIISPEKSLDKTLLEICIKLAQSTPSNELRQLYQWQIPFWKNNIEPQTAPEDLASKITGHYKDGRQVVLENNIYYYINKDKQKIKLTYYGNNIFGMEGKPFTRLRIPDNESPITYFEFIWDDGFAEKVSRGN